MHYTMTRGARKNRIKRRIIFVLQLIAVIVAVFMVVKWSAKRDETFMKIAYCWDEAGEHYVAPNPNCR